VNILVRGHSDETILFVTRYETRSNFYLFVVPFCMQRCVYIVTKLLQTEGSNKNDNNGQSCEECDKLEKCLKLIIAQYNACDIFKYTFVLIYRRTKIVCLGVPFNAAPLYLCKKYQNNSLQYNTEYVNPKLSARRIEATSFRRCSDLLGRDRTRGTGVAVVQRITVRKKR